MADTTIDPNFDPAGDPGRRGTLTITDTVAERIATRAALDTDGVVRRARGLDKITGRELPRVHVHASGGHARVDIDIAARWPAPLAALTAAVRENVTRSLADLAGLQVDSLDIDVPRIVVGPTVVADTSPKPAADKDPSR